MVNKKRPSSGDGFYDLDTSPIVFPLNNSNGFLPPSPPDSPALKSPEKLDFSHAAFDAGDDTSTMFNSRKKRKPSSVPDPKRIWSKDDELVILKGIIAYRNETGVDYLSDSAAFFDYIKDDIEAKVSKDQLVNKTRKLKKRFLDNPLSKKKFLDNLAKKACFTNSHDSESFDLSMAIWGKDKPGCVDGIGNNDKAKGTKRKVRDSVEHEAMTNGEPENGGGSAKENSFDKLPCENVDKNMENETGGKESEKIEAVTNVEPENDDGSAKEKSFDKLPCENVDKNMENETGGKESEKIEAVTNVEPGNDDGLAKGDSCDDKLPSDNVNKPMKKGTDEKGSGEDGVDDELCALQDALETAMFQHRGTYAQKLMLQKLRNLKAKERKELSGEWKSLLVQEALLKSKKHYFSAKLANAVFDN